MKHTDPHYEAIMALEGVVYSTRAAIRQIELGIWLSDSEFDRKRQLPALRERLTKLLASIEVLRRDQETS